MELDFRAPVDADWPGFFALMQETFIESWPEDVVDRMRGLSDLARPIGGFDGDRVEATGGAYQHVLQVPGGTLPCSGITWITVSKRWRRRGVLTDMMRRLQETGAADGEPIAALYAAEGAIYDRFGFGVAARSVKLRVESRHLAALPAPPGRVVEVSLEDALERFPTVFDQATTGRPGVVVRHPRWWKRVLEIAATSRAGWIGARYLVYVDTARRDRGVAVVRLKGSERGLMFDGRCQLIDLHTVDAEASSAIWRYAGTFDQVRVVTARMRPPDDPLPFMLPDLRQVRLTQDQELWLHVTDPIAALQGRRYLGVGALRLRVDDPTWARASGTYELEVSGGVGRCARVTAGPDIELGKTGLGAIYLGSTSPFQLAAAGRIVERRPGAIAEAHRLFHWAPPAWGPDMW